MNARYATDWEQIHFDSVLVAGYCPEDIQKIWGGNALRVLMEGWKR